MLEAGKMTEKEKRDIFMHAVVESVQCIDVFHCLSRQTTGKDATYEGLKDYLLQVESATTAPKEMASTAMMAQEAFRAQNSRGRGQARGAGRLNKTRCYSCGLFGPNCPSPNEPVCYTCQRPGHVAKDCFHSKRAAERQEWRSAKQAKVKERKLETATRGLDT